MKSKRKKVLLIEPNYANKYPPIGLMKLSTYYKNLGGWDVTFFKGDLKQFVIERIADRCIEDFEKIDLRIAKIKNAEKIKKAKKLLRLELDDGFGTRQVVSGIAQWYAPEDLIGKKIIVVANLSPAKLCGVESNGMIVAASVGEDAKVIFVDDSIPVGSKLS